jgi:hypothetical protein
LLLCPYFYAIFLPISAQNHSIFAKKCVFLEHFCKFLQLFAHFSPFFSYLSCPNPTNQPLNPHFYPRNPDFSKIYFRKSPPNTGFLKFLLSGNDLFCGLFFIRMQVLRGVAQFG